VCIGDDLQRAALAVVQGHLARVRVQAAGPAPAARLAPGRGHLHSGLARRLRDHVLLDRLGLLAGTGGFRWQLALATVVVAAMLTLDVVAGGIDPSPRRLSGELSPATVGYWVVLELYLAAVLTTSVLLFWRVARDAPAGLPRLGLRTVSVGLAMIVVYAVVKTVLIVLRGAGVPIDFEAVAPWGRTLQGLGTLLTVAGAVVPAGRRARSVWAAYRSLLMLRPLWKAMRDAFPEVILFSPRRAFFEMAGVDDVHLRLYRRVIEIRDGLLVIRPYRSGSGAGEHREAAEILAALRAREDGLPPLSPETTVQGGQDLGSDTEYLCRVADAFREISRRPTADVS
jgi:hypothetical protein